MPRRTLQACPHPGCPELTTGGRCPTHRRRRRPSAHAQGYDREWRRVSAEAIADEPWCHCAGCPSCDGEPCRRPPREADHIVPRSAGGANVRANARPMCKSCHTARTNRDRA